MKLFHSWKRWQLIALVCVVLTARSDARLCTAGRRRGHAAHRRHGGAAAGHGDAGDVTEPPETAAPTEEPTAAPTEATEAPTEVSTGGHKGHRSPDRRDAACHGGADRARPGDGACRSLVHGLHPPGTTVLDNWDKLSEAKRSIVPSNGIILGTVTVGAAQEGDTVFSVLQRVVSDYNIQMEYSVSPLYQTTYIEGLGNLYEKDCGARSGWMFAVNGVFPNYGASDCTVQDGDSIRWLYTCDLGSDLS